MAHCRTVSSVSLSQRVAPQVSAHAEQQRLVEVTVNVGTVPVFLRHPKVESVGGVAARLPTIRQGLMWQPSRYPTVIGLASRLTGFLRVLLALKHVFGLRAV
jgi:hypothetical protein